MSDQYVGEIRMFAGTYAPQGWAMCDGQILQISGNEALYTLLGTTYGGDGRSTFGVPDMRGRVPVSTGNVDGGNYPLGQKSGTETVTLLQSQIPAHSHLPAAQKATGDQALPTNNVWASKNAFEKPADNIPLVPMSPAAIAHTGGSLPHENLMPYLTVSFIIATEGIFPSQG